MSVVENEKQNKKQEVEIEETMPETKEVETEQAAVAVEGELILDEEAEAEQISEEADEEPAPPSLLEALTEKLEAARSEAAKNFENWQRSAAEMANFKKRQAEQAGRRRAEITGSIISQILPALDDFDLAFQNMPANLSEHDKKWAEGFLLVQRKLLKILETNNVQPIATDGEFDPNLHEAVTYEESQDHESNTIIAELRKGYKIGDRVLRPALVRVAQ